MKLDDVLSEWKKDSVIQKMDLDESSRNTPILHAKYLEMLMSAKLKLKRKQQEQKVLLRDKWMHFSGKLAKDEIDDHGWDYDPFNGATVLKSDYSYYFEADPDLQKNDASITYWKTMVETLQEIVDNLKWRHQTIKNMIEWHRFTSGA